MKAVGAGLRAALGWGTGGGLCGSEGNGLGLGSRLLLGRQGIAWQVRGGGPMRI